MNWNEDWLKADRPPASEHSKRYTIWPTGTGRLAFTYFIVITVLDYLALTVLGGRPIVLAGMPLLIWITLIFALLTIAGIFGFSSRAENEETPSVETPQAEDD